MTCEKSLYDEEEHDKLKTFTNKINARFVIFPVFLYGRSSRLDAQGLVAELDETEDVHLLLNDDVFRALVVEFGVSEVLQS